MALNNLQWLMCHKTKLFICIKIDLALNNLQWLMCHKTKLFICIKMDLALNNLQWLMCHKTKPNQTKKIKRPIGIPE